jgi:hypothetical protein
LPPLQDEGGLLVVRAVNATIGRSELRDFNELRATPAINS